jgi:hypothetical protein
VGLGPKPVLQLVIVSVILGGIDQEHYHANEKCEFHSVAKDSEMNLSTRS